MHMQCNRCFTASSTEKGNGNRVYSMKFYFKDIGYDDFYVTDLLNGTLTSNSKRIPPQFSFSTGGNFHCQ